MLILIKIVALFCRFGTRHTLHNLCAIATEIAINIGTRALTDIAKTCTMRLRIRIRARIRVHEYVRRKNIN